MYPAKSGRRNDKWLHVCGDPLQQKHRRALRVITDRFSGPRRALGAWVCVSVTVCLGNNF